MKILRENTILLLGILVPILMTVLIAASIYLPGLFIKPKYNFIYAVQGYNSNPKYEVVNGKIVQQYQQNRTESYYGFQNDAKIFFHDVLLNSSREVTLSESSGYNLDTSPKSPDGFMIVYGNRDSGILPLFFSSSDYNTRYLKGNLVSKKLDLMVSQPFYYGDFHFLGWVGQR